MKLNRFCASSALVCATGMAFSGISVSAEIEEIVVTGLKKTSSVMETPSAITALTGDDLISRGITELSQLQFAVPSFHYGEMLGNKTIAIRGIGEFNNQPGVLVSIDGVVQSIAYYFIIFNTVTRPYKCDYSELWHKTTDWE